MATEPSRLSVALIPLASPLHDPEAVSAVGRRLRSELAGLYDASHGLITDAAAAARAGERADILILLVLTGGTEHIAMAASGGRPTVLVAHGAMNSLPAAIEAASAMRASGWPTWVVSEPEDIRAAVSAVLAGVRAYHSLRGSRLAVVGEPSSWLVYSVTPPEAAEEKLGVSLEAVPIDELLRRFEMAKVDEEALAGIIEGASAVGVPREEVEKAVMVYSALKSLIAEGGYAAATVRCFDLIQLAGTTGCVAMSLLNGEGVVAGCEADVPVALSMMVAAEISGRPAFIGNLVSASRDSVLLAHCTFPLAEAGSYELTTHFESGKGVSIAASVSDGVEVTVMRFSPDLSKLRALVGTIKRGTPVRTDLCRTQIEVKARGDARALVVRPMGNHYVLAFGDLSKALDAFCSLAEVELELL